MTSALTITMLTVSGVSKHVSLVSANIVHMLVKTHQAEHDIYIYICSITLVQHEPAHVWLMVLVVT